jgi:diguanylate cyclase (GGDEF)-like protein
MGDIMNDETSLDKNMQSEAASVKPESTDNAHDSEGLRADNERLQSDNERLQSDNEHLQARVVELEESLASQQRELEWLYSRAFRDPITGFWTRHYLNVALERVLSHAYHFKHPVGLIMFELDHLERVNDVHGYDAGDALLRAIGAFLHAHIRDNDIVCRHSKEFVLILPNMPLADVRVRAESIRKGVKDLKLHHRGKSLGTTFSVGVASFPEHGSTADEVLKAVGFALFWAKVAGRDHVVVYEQKRASEGSSKRT